MPNSSASIEHDATPSSTPNQPGLPTGPNALPKQRPALAQLRVAMTDLHIGRMCRAVSYELFTYWSPGGNVFPSLQSMADGMGLKRRAVRQHLAHLERVGLWVRIGREDETNLYVLHLPGEVQEGFVKSSTPGMYMPDPPARTCRPPGTYMPVEVTTEVTTEVPSTSSSRARAVCKICGNSWPDKAEYGSTCYKCGHNPSTRKPNADAPAEEPAQEPASCTCGDAYRNSYQRRCVDCDGTPSFAQMDALKEAMSKGKACGHLGIPEKPRRRDGTEKAGVLRAASHLH